MSKKLACSILIRMMFSLLNVFVGVNLLKRPAALSLPGSGKSTKPRLFWLRKISIGQARLPACIGWACHLSS